MSSSLAMSSTAQILCHTPLRTGSMSVDRSKFVNAKASSRAPVAFGSGVPGLGVRNCTFRLGKARLIARTPLGSGHGCPAVTARLSASWCSISPSALSASSSGSSQIGARRSDFMKGDGGNICSVLDAYTAAPTRERKSSYPRAASEDVPAFKGFPPMTEKPKWYWRILACVPYLMPLSEPWMYAETAYSLFAFLEDYEFCTYPFLILIGSLPGWFLLAYFFVAYLGIVRNNRWPHFLRFHVVTGMLLEILLQVLGTINDWVPQSVYWGKIGAHYWLAVSIAFLFIVIDCIRCALNGMYADVPFLSDASYMQIPYE